MGWKDAPVVGGQSSWQNAPVVDQTVAPVAAQPQEPQFSPENPMPGSELGAPLVTDDGQIPWYEQGDEFREQQASLDNNVFSPQFFGSGIPIPTDADGLQLAIQAVGRGAADLAGTPVDMLNLAGNAAREVVNLFRDDKLPMNTNPALGSDDIASTFARMIEQIGGSVIQQDDLNQSDKDAYNTLRFASGAGMGSIGLASRAGKAQSAIGKAVTAPYETQPVRQVITDTAAGAGAGYGVSKAEQISENNEDAGLIESLAYPIAGALVGGKVGSTGTNAAIKTGSGIVDMVDNNLPLRRTRTLPDGTKEKSSIVKRSAGLMQDKASDPELAARNIREMNATTDEAGMSRMTTGAASDDVGLASVEVSERTRDPVPYMERDKLMNTELSQEAASLRDPNADVTAPQRLAKEVADAEIEQAQVQAGKVKQDLRSKEQQKLNLEREADELVDPIRTQRGREAEASKALDDQIGPEGALGERTKIKNEAFDEAAEGVEADVEPIAKSVKAVQDNVNELGLDYTGLPKGFVQKVEKLMPKKTETDTSILDASGKPVKAVTETGGKIDMKSVSEVRREISSAISKARKQGEFSLVDNLSTLKKDINKMIDDTAEFGEAQKYYREEYAPFFGEGYGREYRDTVQRNIERTGRADPAKTAQFFLGGTPDAAADLARIVDVAPDQKAAQNAVERYMTADLASKLGGKPSPRTVNKWIADRADQLDQFPEVKKKFEDLQQKLGSSEAKNDAIIAEIKDVAEELKKAEGNVRLTEQRINKGVLGTLIGEDPDKYVKTILGGKDRLKKIDEVNKLIGDNKAAKEGFKRAVTENLINDVSGVNVKAVGDAADGPLLYNRIAKTMKENREALAKVYSPDEMNKLRRIQKVMESRGNLQLRGTTGSDTAAKQRSDAVWGIMRSIMTFKIGAVAAGGKIAGAKVGLKNTGITPPSARAEALLSRAMLDPEVAAYLLETPVRKLETKEANKTLMRLLGVSEGARQTGRDEE